MTRTINLSNTQFRYQIFFFMHTYGYVWLAEGCHWHLLPRQTCCRHLLTGGMILLIQRNALDKPYCLIYQPNKLPKQSLLGIDIFLQSVLVQSN